MFIIFGILLSRDIFNQTVVMFPTSPDNCSHTTLKGTKKLILSRYHEVICNVISRTLNGQVLFQDFSQL